MEKKDEKIINSDIFDYNIKDEYIISSINNGINPIINLLIDSIDKFSFGEMIEDEIQEKINDKMKINDPPNNYSYIKYILNNDKILIKEKNIINNIEDVIVCDNNNNLIKEENNKNKICGIFTKEDFDIKIDDNDNNNNHLNNSLEIKYFNPLENDNEINTKKNNIKNNITINDNNNNNNDKNKLIYKDNLSNKDDNLKKSQNELNSKTDKEIHLNNDNKSLINIKLDNYIIKKDINNYKYRNNSKYDIIPMKDKILPLEENLKEKKEDVYSRDNINYNDNFLKEKEMNLPLSLNKDEKIIFFNSYENKNDEQKIIKDFEEKDENKNCKKIINPITSNKIDVDDVKEKLIELNEKVERSENNIKIIKNTNEKLLEIINNFQNFENNKNIYSRENTKQNSPKKLSSKRKCYSPSLNNINKYKKIKNVKNNISKEKCSNHKKNKSFSKLKVFIDTNYSKKNKNKNPYFSKLNNYSKMYNRDKYNYKNIKNKLYKYEKIKNEKRPLSRHTIFITGNNNNFNNINNYNINNNINYQNILYERDNNEEIIGNYLYNHSFPSSRKYLNNSEILITNGIGNIYQREIMKLPPEQQPLFYESNSKFFINNFLYNNNIINNNCNDTISFNEQKINLDESFNYKKKKTYNKLLNNNNNEINNLNIYSFRNQKKNIFLDKEKLELFDNNSLENKTNKNINKKKLLDFKDFKIIFEDKDININKKIIQTDDNIIKQAYINNNSYRNKYIEKNLLKEIDKKNNIKNKNKNRIPSLKNKINKKTNFNKENENIIKENGNSKEIVNKYSDYINIKYNKLFGNKMKYNINNLKDNGKINKNENQFMIPFYLINKKELYQNILNYKTKCV